MSYKNQNIINLATLHNNGSSGDYVNSCMWIALQQFFKYAYTSEEKHIFKDCTVGELRKIAEFNESNSSDLNLIEKSHRKCIKNLCRAGNINVNVYFFADNKYNDTLGDILFKTNIKTLSNNKTANIALIGNNYGDHFELIESYVKNSNKIKTDLYCDIPRRYITYVDSRVDLPVSSNIGSNNNANNQKTQVSRNINKEILFRRIKYNNSNNL